jgi:hypothetical protein
MGQCHRNPLSECKHPDVRWQTLRAEWASSGVAGTLELM